MAHTAKHAWADTREIWRDGCEPYDGYTRVILDYEADLIYIVRAVVAPGGEIRGWLSAFMDAPFGGTRVAARQRGPKMGPC